MSAKMISDRLLLVAVITAVMLGCVLGVVYVLVERQ
jgi:hypothetical protein